MKLLLHACCGLCLLPTEQLTAAGTDFDILFLILTFIRTRSSSTG